MYPFCQLFIPSRDPGVPHHFLLSLLFVLLLLLLSLFPSLRARQPLGSLGILLWVNQVLEAEEVL